MSLDTVRQGTVAVLQGGSSAEREISLLSGATVIAALEASGFRVRPVDTASANWMQGLQGAAFVFNVLHGPGGEDGRLPGLLECLGLPYSGSGVLGSALAMDKRRCKLLWRGLGLPTADFVELSADSDWAGVIAQLGSVFVKPASEGSSLGMSAAHTGEELAQAYGKAAALCSTVIAERLIDGPEYTVAILGGKALPAIRLHAAGAFYDYEAKYLSDATEYHIPCGLNAGDDAALAELAESAFASIGCRVWGRVDVMRDPQCGFQLLEVNTIPGMTSHSLVPMAARASGMSIEDLVQRIMVLSLETEGRA